MVEKRSTGFEEAARTHTEQSIFSEFRDFIWQKKKWWMIPILVALLLLGVLVLLSGTGVAPFIYTLF
jgi:hypothetical protein